MSYYLVRLTTVKRVAKLEIDRDISRKRGDTFFITLAIIKSYYVSSFGVYCVMIMCE